MVLVSGENRSTMRSVGEVGEVWLLGVSFCCSVGDCGEFTLSSGVFPKPLTPDGSSRAVGEPTASLLKRGVRERLAGEPCGIPRVPGLIIPRLPGLIRERTDELS